MVNILIGAGIVCGLIALGYLVLLANSLRDMRKHEASGPELDWWSAPESAGSRARAVYTEAYIPVMNARPR